MIKYDYNGLGQKIYRDECVEIEGSYATLDYAQVYTMQKRVFCINKNLKNLLKNTETEYRFKFLFKVFDNFLQMKEFIRNENMLFYGEEHIYKNMGKFVNGLLRDAYYFKYKGSYFILTNVVVDNLNVIIKDD